MNEEKDFFGWQKRIFIYVWITYFSFYLIRLNFSVAMPGLITEFDITKTQLGVVLTSFFISYAIGQFVNGQIGNHINSRYFITIGLVLSSIINIIFGLFITANIFLMSILWALNGFFQSMGWGPSVKTVANWFSKNQRSKYSAILGTSYIVGSVFALFLAGLIINHFNWRFVFIIPAFISLFIAINWLYFGRWSPEQVKLNWNSFVNNSEEKRNSKISFIDTFKLTFLNKYVLIAGFALFGLNIVRYGFLDWAPTFLFEVQKISVSNAAYKSLLFPFTGVLGVLTVGYLSQKYFKNNHAKIGSIMLEILIIAIFLFPFSLHSNNYLSLILLLIIGFTSFGPHVLLVSVLPIDLATPKHASAAAGTIDSLGYMGAALSGYFTGLLVDKFSWYVGICFWLGGAILSCIMMLFLIRYQRNNF